MRIPAENQEGKRQLGRYNHRWEDKIEMDLYRIRCGGTDWIHVAQDKDQCRNLMNKVTRLPLP
jgi:hypothetical protein